jgi:hypothetical protein
MKENERLKSKKSLLKLKTEEQEKKHQLTFVPTVNITDENLIQSNFFERQTKVYQK